MTKPAKTTLNANAPSWAPPGAAAAPATAQLTTRVDAVTNALAGLLSGGPPTQSGFQAMPSSTTKPRTPIPRTPSIPGGLSTAFKVTSPTSTPSKQGRFDADAPTPGRSLFPRQGATSSSNTPDRSLPFTVSKPPQQVAGRDSSNRTPRAAAPTPFSPFETNTDQKERPTSAAPPHSTSHATHIPAADSVPPSEHHPQPSSRTTPSRNGNAAQTTHTQPKTPQPPQQQPGPRSSNSGGPRTTPNNDASSTPAAAKISILTPRVSTVSAAEMEARKIAARARRAAAAADPSSTATPNIPTSALPSGPFSPTAAVGSAPIAIDVSKRVAFPDFDPTHEAMTELAAAQQALGLGKDNGSSQNIESTPAPPVTVVVALSLESPFLLPDSRFSTDRGVSMNFDDGFGSKSSRDCSVGLVGLEGLGFQRV